MKKYILPILGILVVLPVDAAQTAQAVQPMQLGAIAAQCSTPEANEIVDKMVSAFSDDSFTQVFAQMCKEHGTEKVSLIADVLSKTLSEQECEEVMQLFTMLREWCEQYPSAQVLQSPAGQGAELQHQMKLLSMIQVPLVAAIVKRAVEMRARADRDPKVLESLGNTMSKCIKGAFETFEARLHHK